MKPVLQALVLAERVYEDKDSRKKIIVGTFNLIMTGRSDPGSAPVGVPGIVAAPPGGYDPGNPSAYVSLTDVVSGTKLHLEYVNLRTSQVLFQANIEISKAERLDTVELIIPLPRMTMLSPEPGTYSLDVVWEGQTLGSHRLVVKKLEGQ
jgi:hypothetical protein